MEPNVESGAQAFFDGAEAGADVVDAMNDDDVAWQIGADLDVLVACAIGLQHAAVLPAAILFSWIAHWGSS